MIKHNLNDSNGRFMSWCDKENEASIEQEAKNFMKLICMKKS